MDEKLKKILDGLPEKRQRSRLEPYTEFIFELRRRRRTYREIATILAEKCQLAVASSTIVRFVRVRSGAKREKAKLSKMGSPGARNVDPKSRLVLEHAPSDAEIRQRMEALKGSPIASQESARVFEYDPNKPLHLPDHVVRRKPGE
jgi:IS30 family transposase